MWVLHLFVSAFRSTWTCQCLWTNTPPASLTPAAPPAPPERIPSSLTSPCRRNPACPDTQPSWPTADSNGADWPPHLAPLPGLHPQLWPRPSSRWTRCLPCALPAGLLEARTPELPSSPPHCHRGAGRPVLADGYYVALDQDPLPAAWRVGQWGPSRPRARADRVFLHWFRLLCAARVPVLWWHVLGLLQRELGVGVVIAWASAEGDLCSDG